MANSSDSNVIKIDTTATYRADATRIFAIRYVGASSGTAIIYSGTSNSGARLWEASGTANDSSYGLNIHNQNGVYVEVTNSAVVYLYLKN